MSIFEQAKQAFFRGLDAMAASNFAAAESYFRQADQLVPDRVSVVTNLTAVLLKQEKHEEAAGYARRSVELDDQNVEGWLNLGNCEAGLLRPETALPYYDKALALRPDFALAWLSRGTALHELRCDSEALACQEKAIHLWPDLADAWIGKGNILRARRQYEEALTQYRHALTLAPESADAWLGCGNVFREQRKYPEALDSYQMVLKLQPNTPFVLGHIAHIKMHLCVWDGLGEDWRSLLESIPAGKRVLAPFASLSIPATPAQQLICARQQARTYVRASVTTQNQSTPSKRIRIGYFSADFHEHATAYLMAELFERHSREHFEITAFSFGPDSDGPMRSRLIQGFDRFIDVSQKSDREVVDLSRGLNIDIAVDLKGYTEGARSEIFSMRAAPLQISFIGYPGSMGADFIDYIVADPTVIPAEQAAHYSEKIICLPDTYQVNDSSRMISARDISRSEVGLPEDAFVFCCFNSNYKITPDVFAVWMQLLAQVEDGVLWLLQSNPHAAENLRTEAFKYGISSERLIFALPMPLPEHLARHRLADLFLDTRYYNAHTTASDALWAGLPIVTMPGDTFASRVCASLLHAVDLPELIVQSLAEYRELALSLALAPQRLAQLKEKLQRTRDSCALFDANRFTRHLESAYQAVWARYCNNQLPEHIQVDRMS